VRISGAKDTAEAGKADRKGKKAKGKGDGGGNAGPKG
jgi:hypothetical protein